MLWRLFAELAYVLQLQGLVGVEGAVHNPDIS
jgi:hypothetical protein